MISPGDTILAGVSGGPDSAALLHLLSRLKTVFDCRLYAAHLNHMFRGEDAEADARQAGELARRWEIPFVMERVNVPEYLSRYRLSPQQGAREVRYRFFERTAAGIGANRVALGHHADDQAETVLINLIRGTGITGLAGIPPVREGVYIRPLLTVRRSQIELYCRYFDIPYRLDRSNLQKKYLRNRVRLELIPILEEKYNPAMVDSLNRLAGIAREEDQYLDFLAGNAMEEIVDRSGPGRLGISLEGLLNCSRAMRRRVLRLAFREQAGAGRHPSFEHIERALLMAEAGQEPGTIEFPGGIRLVKRRRCLEIVKGKESGPIPFYRYEMQIPGITRIPETGRVVLAEIMEAADLCDLRCISGDQTVLDMERLKGPLFVRRRQEGDRFTPLGGGGTLKLKKFFINNRVPREERDAIPVVTCGNDIIWVAGYRPGEAWKVTEKTRLALRLKLGCE